MLRRLLFLALIAPLYLYLALGHARAQPGPAAPPESQASPPAEVAPPSDAPVVDEKLARAKERFRAGNTFLQSGDYERALQLFVDSRRLVASYHNTVNAAICLDRLERYDEALELYETALIEFPRDMTPELRASLEPKLRELRERIGSIEVSANVTGTVIIDGRERGKLPLAAAIRVLPGERSVRVLHDGYDTFERRVKVTAKEKVRVDARLKALASAGRLRVEAPEGLGAELRVDGAVVGTVPWEGTLGPGSHLFEVVRDDVGSGPRRVTVLQGQTVLERASMHALSRTVRLSVTPPSAKLSLDNMPIDSAWQGRLTVGRHQLTAREEGYRAGTRELMVQPATAGELRLELAVDPNHPRWVKATPTKLWLEAYGAYALAPSLGSKAEECGADQPCSNKSTGHGILAGLRGAYELPVHLSLEVGAAYVGLQNSVTRLASAPFENTVVTYELHDQLRMRGALVTAGVGYRQPFGSVFGLQVRVHVGALVNRASDSISAEAFTSDRGSAVAMVERTGLDKQNVALAIAPELQASLKLGGFRIGAGASALVLPLVGPSSDAGDLYVPPASVCHAPPNPIDCAGGSATTRNERLFGPFWAIAPGVSVGYEL